MAVNDKLFDALVRHQIGLQRLAAGTARDLIGRLDQFDKQIVAILRKLDSSTSKPKLNKALRDMRAVNIKAYLAVEKDMTKALQALAVAEVDHAHDTTNRVLPKDARRQVDLVKPAKEDIAAAVTDEPINGALLEEHINGMEVGRYNRMRDTVRREVTAGGTDAAVQAGLLSGIVGSKEANYKDGLLDYSRRSLDQSTRTLSNGVANQARSDFTAENPEVFDSVQWVAVLDNRTSDICANLDGTVFPVDEGPRPPAHPNCRSMIVPVIKDWEAMGLSDLGPGTRESMSGEVPETMTYGEWLKTQPQAIQDEILGPTRGGMFRDGMPLDRFIDDTGRRFTLAELRAQEAFDTDALYSASEVGAFDVDALPEWTGEAVFEGANKGLAEALAAAKTNQELLADAMKQLTKEEGGVFINPGVKANEARILDKLVNRASAGELTDLVRGGVTLSEPAQADALIAALSKRFQLLDEGWKVTEVDYFDRKVLIRFPNGQVGELQFWQPNLIAAKNEIGHDLYVEWRGLNKGSPEALALTQQMKDLYGRVLDGLSEDWRRLLNR